MGVVVPPVVPDSSVEGNCGVVAGDDVADGVGVGVADVAV